MYDFLWYLGKLSGCHQRPDRSFFLKGKQFPVCARCTGAFIGYAVGFGVFVFYRLHWSICLVLCLVMFADWFVQRIGLLQSNNIRRLITGMMCGFGLIHLYLSGLLFVAQLIDRLF